MSDADIQYMTRVELKKEVEHLRYQKHVAHEQIATIAQRNVELEVKLSWHERETLWQHFWRVLRGN